MRTGVSRCFLLFLSVVGSSYLFCQPPQSDPQALSLAAQSIATLTRGSIISDVTLSGTGNWIVAETNENANATLMAKGTSESRFDMTLSAGPRSEIRNDGSNTALGEVRADGSIYPWSVSNCLVNAVWFFPHLSVLGASGDPTLIFTYVGLETRNGVSVQHLQSYRYSQTNTADVQQSSTMDIYIDAASLLPTTFVFNVHADDASAPDLPVEVDFSNYQAVNGVLVPFHIQRYVAGNLGFDFLISAVQFNSGLSDSLFATD